MVYPIRPEQWPTTPIRREVNPLTGLIEGDDAGYRKVRTLPDNAAPVVVPNVMCRPNYDGIDEYGNAKRAIALPGGLVGGALVVRETFARDIDDADALLQKVFGGQYRLCALDGFRSWERQAAGFSRLLRFHMERLGVTEDNVGDRVVDFIKAGNLADGTMAWVNADVDSAVYKDLVVELRKDAGFMSQIREFAATLDGGLTDDNVSEALYVYVTISANSDIGRAANRSIPLVFECNAHAGGGACDMFLLDGGGLPLNHIPFDYPGPEAAMDYLEDDAHFDVYREIAVKNELIRKHLLAIGIAPERFSRSNWDYFRASVRVLYHLSRAKGWTYYSSDHGGENWHLEGGNIAYDALTGDVVASEKATAGGYPNSGNPGHALQKYGRDATAVWGGASGHAAAASFVK